MNRTFPQIAFFSKPNFLNCLEHVLCAYSQIDTDLGYTQGMGFIAGTFLMYMDEDLSLWALHGVMNGFRTMHRDFFAPPFPRLQLASKMLNEVLKTKYPKILANIENLGISFDVFAPKWFMSAFLCYSWTPEMHLRIFDRFLFYGTRSLLSFALVIFSRHKDVLEIMPLEELIPLLQKPDLSPKMKDWRYLMQKWDKLWINKKTYQQLLKKAGAPPERLE